MPNRRRARLAHRTAPARHRPRAAHPARRRTAARRRLRSSERRSARPPRRRGLAPGDFETDALVPSVLASVVAYSVFIAFFGEATLFTRGPSYPFVPQPICPLCRAARGGCLDRGERWPLDPSRRAGADPSNIPPSGGRSPAWGLALGVFATPMIMFFGPHLGQPGQGLGILGGSCGRRSSASAARRGFPLGWRGVGCWRCQVALRREDRRDVPHRRQRQRGETEAFTRHRWDLRRRLWSGGAAALPRPRIDPGAFALVGMAVLWSLAHVPIASLVMTCELAGNYDTPRPAHALGEGIAFILAPPPIALRGAECRQKARLALPPARTSSSTC